MKARPATVQSVVSVLALGLAVLGNHSPTEKQGRRPSQWGFVRVSGRGRFVCHGSVVMAGWHCPQGDASSRWLIVIRTDLFLPTPTMIAVQIRMCAARA